MAAAGARFLRVELARRRESSVPARYEPRLRMDGIKNGWLPHFLVLGNHCCGDRRTMCDHSTGGVYAVAGRMDQNRSSAS